MYIFGLRDDLESLSSDAASQLDVLGHDGDSLGVDGLDWCPQIDQLGKPCGPPKEL